LFEQKTDQSSLHNANRQKNIKISKIEALLFITNLQCSAVNNFVNSTGK